MVFTRYYHSEDLPFSRGEALRYFGMGKKGAEPGPELESLFAECAREAMSACVYRVCYAEFAISGAPDGSLDLSFTKTDSRALANNLRGCTRTVAFAATVGIGIDRLIARASAVSQARAYAFQAIGAERIEALCDRFSADIAAEYAKKGFAARPRFSCGYGDFPIEKQRDFFLALDCQRKIGVALSDSLLMTPSKSVTAVIGLRPGESGEKGDGEKGDRCSRCGAEDCGYRHTEA